MATETYKNLGSKVPGEARGDIILEGSVSNPVKVIPVGGVGELDDDQVKALRDSGYNLRKSSDDDEGTAEAAAPESDTPDQPASGAQHPAATPDQDNTPAAREQRGARGK